MIQMRAPCYWELERVKEGNNAEDLVITLEVSGPQEVPATTVLSSDGTVFLLSQ